MNIKHFLGLLISFSLLFACSKKKEVKTQNSKANLSSSPMHVEALFVCDELDSITTKRIENWKEYFVLKKFLRVYKKISPRVALYNAVELKELTKKVKDSSRVSNLQTPAFRARVNVFENEVLRLADMVQIPSISADEVNFQVKKIFLAFGSLNTKIIHTFRKESFDDSVKVAKLNQKNLDF
ncbi:MAG: hypothetical protein ACK5H1_10350 [Tenacibaculum sp.]